MACWSACVALLMLLIGQLSAGPETAGSRNSCQDQNSLHNRMDVVEKRVEATVQKLEAELAVLLDAIEAPEWSHLLETDGTTPITDILEESSPSQSELE